MPSWATSLSWLFSSVFSLMELIMCIEPWTDLFNCSTAWSFLLSAALLCVLGHVPMSDFSDWSAGWHEFCQGSSTGWLAFVHWFVLMLMLQGSIENNQYTNVLCYKNSGTSNNCRVQIKSKCCTSTVYCCLVSLRQEDKNYERTGLL